jgi:hypothetical protein
MGGVEDRTGKGQQYFANLHRRWMGQDGWKGEDRVKRYVRRDRQEKASDWTRGRGRESVD